MNLLLAFADRYTHINVPFWWTLVAGAVGVIVGLIFLKWIGRPRP